MAIINGSADWGFQPVASSGSNELTQAFYEKNTNHLKSANDPLRYEIRWFSSGLTEAQEPSASNWDSATSAGDVVNVIFKVYTYVDSTYKELIGTIKKSRDIANKKYDSGSVAVGHRFTLDVSQLVSDQLSYSLCPINKGTWQSNKYGGMNGGLVMQHNVIGNAALVGNPVSNYNVSKNGTYRRLEVTATFEVINGDGEIIDADGTSAMTSNETTVINSVNQFERDSLYYNTDFVFNTTVPSSTESRRFLSRCPNWYYNTTANSVAYNKKVRMSEEAEWLQFYVKDAFPSTQSYEYYNLIELYGETFTADGTLENTFVLVDFTALLDTEVVTGVTVFSQSQEKMVIQNVSPTFINANAKVPQDANAPYSATISPITTSTHRYRLYYRGHYNDSSTWTSVRSSSSNWYEIDREDEKIPYGFVRFHWLNSMGGIDSYTAKRDIVEGISIGRDVVERKSVDRTWYQNDTNEGTPLDNSIYHSDTMRGGDIYKGGREVSNVNAERNQSVYTEPLNIEVAKWLEEIMLSPNVWIEKDTDATAMGNTMNPYLRPSTKEYIPVIITNTDIETVNQENGLVKFNIDYTLSHKLITQRN